MPHCILEYSANVADQPDLRELFVNLHDVLMGTGLFKLADIKSRAIRHEVFLIGEGNPERAFVTLNIQILGGRSDEQKATLSEGAVALLQRFFPETLKQRAGSLTVQVSELHRPSYRRLQSREG